jgi:hypothetical protein
MRMPMRRVLMVVAACALVVGLCGCGAKDVNCCRPNSNDSCYDCPDGGTWYDGWNNDNNNEIPDGGSEPPNNGGCTKDRDCRHGEVCAPGAQCMELVLGCPLTDECLLDPEGYTSEWQGIDPTYVGSFQIDNTVGKVIVDIDFYEDHFFGEGWVDDGQSWLAIPVAVTGTREGALLWGQAIQTDGGDREFDAVFDAELLSASEIVVMVTVASDDGEFSFDFTLLRTSPCGCEHVPGCLGDRDCPEGQTCEEGLCAG